MPPLPYPEAIPDFATLHPWSVLAMPALAYGWLIRFACRTWQEDDLLVAEFLDKAEAAESEHSQIPATWSAK